jgi:hypothetical protein
VRPTLLAAALVLAGCATPASGAGGAPAIRHLHLRDLPAAADHAHDTPIEPGAAPIDRDDPVAVAVDLIVGGLTGQGLEVVDLGHDLVETTDDRAIVRVAATHQATAGGTHTSVYELELTRPGGQVWTLAGFRQVQ